MSPICLQRKNNSKNALISLLNFPHYNRFESGCRLQLTSQNQKKQSFIVSKKSCPQSVPRALWGQLLSDPPGIFSPSGLPLPVRVTRSYPSPGPGTLRAASPQPPTDRAKNRPDARGRSAAANPIRQPGALGTIFVFPFIPGWGFSSFFPLLLWGPHILPGVPLPDRVTPLEAQRGRMVPFILRRSEERAGCPRPACGLTGGDVGDPSSSHGGGWGRGIFF